MVVEDGGRAALDAVDERDQRTVIDIVKGERAVQAPPEALEDLGEVARGCVLEGHAAGEGGVQVHVRVDEAGHDEAAAGVEKAGARVAAAQFVGLAHGQDAVGVDGHGSVVEVGTDGVAGDEAGVADQQHGVLRRGVPY